jgi:hypothetical protein
MTRKAITKARTAPKVRKPSKTKSAADKARAELAATFNKHAGKLGSADQIAESEEPYIED